MDILYLGTSFAMMMLTASCFYVWFLHPRLITLERHSALLILTSVHCLRFISPISLVAGATVPGLDIAFSFPQIAGDMTTALSALIAVASLRAGWGSAIAITWFVHLFGLLDLSVVAVQGLRFNFASHVGSMFYVVAWLVPVLLVSHAAALAIFLPRRGDYAKLRPDST